MIFTTASSESIVVFLTMKTMNWTLLRYRGTTALPFPSCQKKTKIQDFYSGES